VLATHWRIDDRSTVRFIDDFYGELARGLTVADALRSAKLRAIESGARASTWAAFTVVGDPLVTIPLQTPKPANWRWLAGVLVLLAVAAATGTAYTRRSRWR
jgi:hypothetical protein